MVLGTLNVRQGQWRRVRMRGCEGRKSPFGSSRHAHVPSEECVGGWVAPEWMQVPVHMCLSEAHVGS